MAIGRLPNGQGFGIWAQRYHFQGRDYVQLIASTAPVASSVARIREELERGDYGSSEENIDELTAPVALSGIVGCAKHPVVLLYGLVHEPIGAAFLRSRGHDLAFERVAIPRDLGAGGVLGYGFLTADATLQIRSPAGALAYSEEYPGPPSQPTCAGGTESVIYAFPKKGYPVREPRR